MARLTFIVLAAAVLRSWAVSTLRKADTKRNFNVKVIREFDHEDKPFTQGLEYDPDTKTLIETSGSFPEGTKSFIRSLDPKTGKTLWKNEDSLTGAFVEGITRTNGHWFASVYQEPRKAIEYDSNFKYVKNHSYYFDGWGLTRTPDDKAFLATNGSSTVMKLDKDFKLLESKVAMCHGKPVPGLNELEMVKDFQGTKKPALLGNVYTSRIVLALDPDTMECTGAFHLEGLNEPFESGETSGYHVANGIAYRPESDTFFVTGKNWNKMFEVKLEEEHIATNSAFTKLAEWQELQHTAPGLGLIQLAATSLLGPP